MRCSRTMAWHWAADAERVALRVQHRPYIAKILNCYRQKGAIVVRLRMPDIVVGAPEKEKERITAGTQQIGPSNYNVFEGHAVEGPPRIQP